MGRRLTPFHILCVMGGLAILSSTMAKNPALPLFLRSMGMPTETLGLIAAASTMVGIVVSIPAGILSDVIGRRRVLLLSMGVFATAPFLYLVATLPWHLVVIRVYHGLATAILGPVAMATVADLYDARRGERMAWYSSATMVGRFIAPTLGGLLIVDDNFQYVYLVDGLAGVLALLAALQLPRLGPEGERSKSAAETWRHGQGGVGHNTALARVNLQLAKSRVAVQQDLAALMRNAKLLATSLIEAMQYLAFGFIEVFLPLYLREVLGMETWRIGTLFTAQLAAAALSKPLAGRLSDRWGRVPMITAGLSTCALVTIMIPVAPLYPLLFVLLVAFGLGMAAVTTSTSAFVADLSKASSHGAALGTLSSIMDVGHSLGPIIGGLLVAALGYGPAFFYVGLGLAAVIGGYAWTMARAGELGPTRAG